MERRSHAERRRSAARSFRRFVPEAEPDRAEASFARRLGPLGAFAFETVGAMWDRPELDRRGRSLAVVSALAAQARADELAAHTEIGLRHGLTRVEIEEILPHVAALAGFPAAMAAARHIDDGLRRAEGVDRLSAREGVDALDDAARDELASSVGLSRTNEATPLGELWHRWYAGQIWSRPQLGPRDRSIVTIAVLVTLGAGDPLADAIRDGLGFGLTTGEVDEIIAHLGLYAGLVRATEAAAIASEVAAGIAPTGLD